MFRANCAKKKNNKIFISNTSGKEDVQPRREPNDEEPPRADLNPQDRPKSLIGGTGTQQGQLQPNVILAQVQGRSEQTERCRQVIG